MTLDANPPHDAPAGSEGRCLPLDSLRFFVPESMVPAAGELSTPRTWIPDRVPRAGLRIYAPEGPRRWLSPTLWGAAGLAGVVPAMEQSPARGESEAGTSDKEVPVPLVRREHAPRATRAAAPIALALGPRAAQPPSTIWEANSPCSPGQPELAGLSSPSSTEEPVHIRQQPEDEAQCTRKSSPVNFRRTTLHQSSSHPSFEICTDGFRQSPCSDVVPQRCCSLSEDSGQNRQSDAIGRTMSAVSRVSCDAFAEKAIRGMTALETEIDELARMASAGEVSQHMQDFCFRVAERLKGEMSSMENDLLDLCSVMEEEFEVQCQSQVAAEIEAYEQCLIAVHVEVCRLFDRANREVENLLLTSTQLHDVLERMQTALFISKIRTEQLIADKRVLQAELDALRLENRSNENAATIKDEVMQALQQHKKTLADHQSEKDLALKGQIETLQRQLDEAMQARDEALSKQHHAEGLIEKARAQAYKGQTHPECAVELGDMTMEHVPHLPVLRELQATLRTSEAERNRLQTELVARYEENSTLTEALQRSNSDRLALETEVTKMRNSLVERKGHESSGASGDSTPPLSCHSQNPADCSPGIGALSSAQDPVPLKARYLDERLSFPEAQAFKPVLTEGQAARLKDMCDELQCARTELDSFSTSPALCEVCNANVQRRWRPKGRMLEYLANKSSFLVSSTSSFCGSPRPAGYDDPTRKAPLFSASPSLNDSLSPSPGVDWFVEKTMQGSTSSECNSESLAQDVKPPSPDVQEMPAAESLVAEKVTQRALRPSTGWQVFGEMSPATRPAPAIFGESTKAHKAQPSRW